MRKIQFMLMVVMVMFIAGFASCSKEEGPGGTSTIVGKVWVRDYNSNFTILNREYWAIEQDVYLVYGSDAIYSDRFRTNYDGSYWFQYLREGDYTVFAYSKDSTFTVASEVIPVMVKVSISDKGQTIEAPVITILD